VFFLCHPSTSILIFFYSLYTYICNVGKTKN
jgi:hypothetical protein